MFRCTVASRSGQVCTPGSVNLLTRRCLQLDIARRPRRLRLTPGIRKMVQETRLSVDNLVQPLFVVDGDGDPQPIASLPGQFRLPMKGLLEECAKLSKLHIPAVALFPYINPSLKDPTGTYSYSKDTLVVRAIKEIKIHFPHLTIITDVALDPYTTHGHDGILTAHGDDVDNDKTVEALLKMALASAEGGADFVAPSDMMDGRIRAIRQALDQAGHTNVGIISYAVKYASAFYGPFRDAVGTSNVAASRLTNKSTYQMDPANRLEARMEARLDEEEGADILMVKPAGPYLDVIRELKSSTTVPIAAYQVSGEYAQLMAASQKGWLSLPKTRDETLLSIKRAGADLIFTYFAKDWALARKNEEKGNPL
eukprot:TRINITY_DN5746_c0_g1_i1.p1 TRINITY_DN5746_c0_g1~~TRINITY_DN5746_c0_g1_i1.p1  ORF type:complete len:367 (-),score=36.19 TRINITY_DN5746_c0_g1_i1:23-1123(-)